MSKKIIAGAVAAAVIGMVPMTASAVNFKDVMAGKTDFSIGGYIKVDAMVSDYEDFEPGAASTDRTFYFPAGMRGTGSSSEENVRKFDAHARQSRINFKTSSKIDGHSLTSYIEMDFMTTSNGNEIISNSYSPRLRHAFIKFDNWLIGQTWSTFMNVYALPESVDFVGPTESTVFIRQPMIRYSNGGLMVALENPESFGAGVSDRDDNELPDLVARYVHKGDFGHVSLGGVVRQLTVETAGPGGDDTATGWGLSLSGKIKVGAKDDIRFELNHGEGVGRYVGVAIAQDAFVDSNGDLETIELTAWHASYRHFWTDKLRSNFIYGTIDIDQDSDAGFATARAEEVTSYQVNLMYSPVKPLTFGVMYMHSERDDFDGVDMEMDRVQVSAKYAF